MIEFGQKESGKDYVERRGSYGVTIKDNLVFVEKGRLGYFLPGGGLEEGELAEAALVREYMEETGHEIARYEKFAEAVQYGHIFDQDVYIAKVQYFYRVVLGKPGIPTHPDGADHFVGWVPIDEVKKEMHLTSQWWAVEQVMTRS